MKGANVPNVPIVPEAPAFTMQSPLWGRCNIVPRDSDPTDAVAMGYVALLDDPSSLKLAIWKRDKWLDHKLKDFPVPVVQSYSVEKADGSPLF